MTLSHRNKRPAREKQKERVGGSERRCLEQNDTDERLLMEVETRFHHRHRQRMIDGRNDRRYSNSQQQKY